MVKKKVKKKAKVSSSAKKRKSSKKRILKKSAKRKAVKKKISKKKVLKKPAKRKDVKKRIPNKSPAQVKKDLELFSKGVERLKELKRELASLDTRGFAKEEQSIRSKLQNVSDIPVIERELKNLKQKINRRYRPKRKKVSATRKELRELKEEDLPEIKSAIRKLSARVGDSDAMKARVDSGVGAVIDTDFNTFLTGVKVKFSNRIREREKEIDDVLKKDLAKREEKYKNKQDNLLKDFEYKRKKLEEGIKKKYDVRVKSELHKEVARNFNDILRKKLAAEKVELGKRYKSELKAHADMKLQNEEKNLKRSFDSKMQKVQKMRQSLEMKELQASKDLEGMKKELRVKDEEILKNLRQRKANEIKKIKDSLANKFHEQLEKGLRKKEKVLRNQLKSEYNLRLKKQLQEHETELKKKRIEMELEMQKKLKQMFN